MKIAKGTIILVVDGSHMLLMVNQGDADRSELKVIEHRGIANPPDRDLAADAPGIVHESAGPGQSTYEETGLHQKNEDQFAIQAAHILNETVGADGGAVVAIAPARTLAILRRHYGQAVRERLVAEMDKDLAHCPVPEITERIMRFEPRRQPRLSLRA